MSEEDEKKRDTELGFHWDQDVQKYVCERCGAKWLFRVHMIRHILEHLDQERGDNANRR